MMNALFAASVRAHGLLRIDRAQISVCLTSRPMKYGWKRIIIRLNSSELVFCVPCYVCTSRRRKSKAIILQGFISPLLSSLCLTFSCSVQKISTQITLFTQINIKENKAFAAAAFVRLCSHIKMSFLV